LCYNGPMQKPCEEEQLDFDFTPKPDIADGMNALDKMLCQAYRKDLESESPKRRRRAVKGLARLPRCADTSIPALEEALNDQDYDVRKAAAAALSTLASSR
jgi:vesicle coat complex subunit